MSRPNALLVLIILCTLCGCGYRPVSTNGNLTGASGVHVVLFGNTSYRSGIEGVLAREMVDELARRTGGAVVSGDKASTVLTGTVVFYDSGAVSYTEADTIREYRARVDIEAVLRDAVTQQVLWKEQLSEDQVYPVNRNIALQQNSEDAAIQKICRRLSENVWQRLSERF